MGFQIRFLEDIPSADEALEALLVDTYIDGGFTDPEFAPMFRADAVRSRGRALVAVDESTAVVGTITVVGADSAASQLATAGEVEFHLLCVSPALRSRGIGRALVEAALTEASHLGARAVVLWTQPTMQAAQRLYERSGFHRDSSADFIKGGREFLVYRRLVFE